MRDIKQFNQLIRFKYVYSVVKTIMKGYLSPGKITEKIEKKIQEIHDIKNCICVNSGTTALMVAIKALNLKQGSTILAPAYSFIAAHNAARFLGYRIKLIDINPYTLCLNPYKLKYTKNISCVIFIDHNGYHGSDLYLTKEFCVKHNIPLVEDAAQCLGINKTGQVGDIAILSFSYPKIATGAQGGAILTDNNQLAEKCRNIIDHGGQGWRQDRIHKSIGLNLRFNDILGSYLLPQLNDLKSLLNKRWKVFNNYYKNGIKPFRFAAHHPEKESLWMVIYRSKKADQIIEALKKENIQAVKYYRPICDNLPYKTKIKYPVAEQIYKELIYLPSSLNLKRKKIKRICRIIKGVEEKDG